MKKYNLATKKGQTVYHIEVGIRSEDSKFDSTCINKEGIYINELKIVHQTKIKIALSNDWITVLDRQSFDERKQSHSHYLNDIAIRIKTKETYFPNGIFASCYTIGDPEKYIRDIKRQIIIKINKEYGFLFSGVGEKLENLEIHRNN